MSHSVHCTFHFSLTILSPLLSFASCGSIALYNRAHRYWLLTNANHPKFSSDARHGNLLLALHLTESAPLDSILLFEWAHHLLRAHPYKYMHGKYIPEFTSSKDGQIHWIKRCSKDIGKALLNYTNMFFPNTKVTQLLLMAGADVNAFDSSSTLTVMQQAVAAGNAHLVSSFLSNGGVVPQPQVSGEPALTIAAKFGHIELHPLLFPLDNMLTVETASVERARNGHRKVNRYLLAQVWNNASKRITAIESALIVAAGAGQTKACELLIDSYGLNDLAKAMCAACEQGRADTVQFFLSRLPWLAALICAAENGSWDFVVTVLSQAKCDIECKDAFGRTPIIAAARCMHVGLIDLLLNKGAEINQQDNRGWSALMHAVSKNHLPSVQLLLDRNAKSSVKDEDGRTLAHIACSSASRLVVDRLLECGMPIEDCDNDGLYPIQIAILRQNRDALEALLTRKKRFEDAMHRLHYALNKCELCLKNRKLQDIHSGLTKVRLQIMVSMARVLRRQGRTQQAIEACSFIETDACERVRFESLLLQAKCHFDLQDLERAKVHARAAVHLRPEHDEARQLLNTPTLPLASIARL